MLAVTADNASANDVMTDELEELVESFQGQSMRVRCFDHILNLVVKTILRQFDIEQRRKGADLTALDAAEAALHELANDLEDEEEDGGEFGELAVDDIDGWVDERRGLSEEEIAQLENSTRPVKFVLVKVYQVALFCYDGTAHLLPISLKLRKLANTVINSSTKLLPAWRATLEQLDLGIENMPRDVRTRWNSTFRMLDFALEYRAAIEALTGDRSMDLHKLELDDVEWALVNQLRDVLQVCHIL